MRTRGSSSGRHDAKYLCVKFHSTSVVMSAKLSMIAHVAVFGDFLPILATLTLNEGLQNMHGLKSRAKKCQPTKFVKYSWPKSLKNANV